MKRIVFFCTDKDQHRRILLGEGNDLTGFVRSRHARNAPERPMWSETGEWLGGYGPGETARRTRDGRTVLTPYARVRADGKRGPDGRLEVDEFVGADLVCPKCGRAPQISPTLMHTAMAGLVAAGITEVDISRLPF